MDATIKRLQAYRIWLTQRGRLIEARAVARCIEIAGDQRREAA
jgi:hypothetical protein